MDHFRTQLDDLLEKLLEMGTLAEEMVQLATQVIVEQNTSLVAKVFASEQRVNALQVEVDDRAVELTALQQPMATDVRFLFMASRIGGELERIADQAVNICQNAKYVLAGPATTNFCDLATLSKTAQQILRESLMAVSGQDILLANRINESHKNVNGYRDRVFKSLIAWLSSDPSTAQQAMSLVLIAHNLGRIADHAVNIAEEVIYWVEGIDVRYRANVGAISNGFPAWANLR